MPSPVGTHTVTLSGGPPAVDATNLFTNPSAETNVTGWTGAVTRDNTRARFGAFATLLPIGGDGFQMAYALPGNTQHTVSAYVWVPGTVTGTITPRIGSSAVAAGSNGPPITLRDQWVRVQMTFTTDTDGGNLGFYPALGGAGGQVWADGLQLVRGAVLPEYFDGDTPDTATYLYAWSGTAHGSSSTRSSSPIVDMSCLVDKVTIHHGREDTTDQPEPAVATLELDLHPDLGPVPVELEIGSRLAITTTPPGGATVTRFAGRVTDLNLGWEDAGEDTPEARIGQLQAVAYVADLGRRTVGEEPWPAELDGARVARIMTAAGAPLNPATSDPGRVTILARDIDTRDALSTAQDVAVSASGMVWHSRAGEVRYADVDHRKGVAVALDLDACDVLVTPTWRRTVEGLINRLTLGYGVAPEGGQQPTYFDERPESIARYGTYAFSLTSELSTLADAQALAQMLLVRNIAPVWNLAALPIDIEAFEPARYAALLGLEVHDLIRVTGFPAMASAPTSAALWVEGWTETLTAGRHELDLTVSGYCRTAPSPQWDTLDPNWTWDALDPTLTWDAISCLGPMTSFGRWSDVPASTRWDTVPPGTTWDTWK
jgi:hypothetical protein